MVRAEKVKVTATMNERIVHQQDREKKSFSGIVSILKSGRLIGYAALTCCS
jgi:hypothetical protein